MKKILLGMLLAVTLIAIFTSVIFGILFLDKTNNANALAKSNQDLNAIVKDLNAKVDELSKPAELKESKFVDDGLGISVSYTADWQAVLDTNLSKDFAFDPTHGRVISDYILEFKNGSTTLKFDNIHKALDGFGDALKNSGNDIVKLSDKVVRYSAKDKNEWKYVSVAECTGSDVFGPVDTKTSTCVGSFFPGFSNLGATTVTINSSDATLLKEADAIVLSAVK